MNFRVESGRCEILGEKSEFSFIQNGQPARCSLSYDPVLAQAAASLANKYAKAKPLDFVSALQNLGFELIGALETPSHLYLFNDWFGRVPLYAFQNGKKLVAGDALGEFPSLLGHPFQFDPLALRQYLWCTYVLGSRTLYRDIFVADPGSVYKIDRQSGAIELIKNPGLFDFSFDQTSPEYSLNEARDLFLASFQRRYAKYPNIILSLSGGQDSRAVLAGLEHFDLNYNPATFYFPGRSKFPDYDTAKLLVAATRHPERWVATPIEDSAQQEDELLRLKGGMNYLGVNWMVGYLSQLREKFPRDSIFLTGDGGDKALPDLRDLGATTEEKLIDLILRRSSLNSPGDVERWVPADASIREMVTALLRAYPEKDSLSKSKTFVIRERARKCVFEGEDRNRKFFVSSTPFFDPEFFRYLMRVPDEPKAGYLLYREFQNLLSPKFAAIPDALGYSVNSWRYEFHIWAHARLRVLPTRYKNQLRKMLGMGAALSPAKQESLRALIDKIGPEKYFNVDALRASIPTLNTFHYQHLRTVLRAIECGMAQ